MTCFQLLKNNLLLFASLIFVLLSSCVNEKYQEYNFIFKEYENKIGDNETIIVIPNEGCGACISGATNYIQNNIDKIDSRYLVIYTRVQDFKLFLLTYPKELLNNENIVFDKKNMFSQIRNTISIYPQIIRIKNGKIVDISNFENYDLF